MHQDSDGTSYYSLVHPLWFLSNLPGELTRSTNTWNERANTSGFEQLGEQWGPISISGDTGSLDDLVQVIGLFHRLIEQSVFQANKLGFSRWSQLQNREESGQHKSWQALRWTCSGNERNPEVRIQQTSKLVSLENSRNNRYLGVGLLSLISPYQAWPAESIQISVRQQLASLVQNSGAVRTVVRNAVFWKQTSLDQKHCCLWRIWVTTFFAICIPWSWTRGIGLQTVTALAAMGLTELNIFGAVRDPSKATLPDGIKVVQGDQSDQASALAALKSADADGFTFLQIQAAEFLLVHGSCVCDPSRKCRSSSYCRNRFVSFAQLHIVTDVLTVCQQSEHARKPTSSLFCCYPFARLIQRPLLVDNSLPSKRRWNHPVSQVASSAFPSFL